MIDIIPIATVLVGSIDRSKLRHCVYTYSIKNGPTMEFFESEEDARKRHWFLNKPEVFSGLDAVLLFINKRLEKENIRNTVLIHFDEIN